MGTHMNWITTYSAVVVIVLVATRKVDIDVLVVPTVRAVDHFVNDVHPLAPYMALHSLSHH